jgi:glycosyltransferase involved in cell wall biosynthesis
MMATPAAPKVSIIINCLNGEKYLREAIDSVYAQTFTDWEIIFWDNASTDGTAQIARSYDEKLRYFRGTETIPLGAARNKALAQTQGELVAFLDSDDKWLPTKLEKQVPRFTDPEIGFVYANFYKLNMDTGRQSVEFRFRHPPTGKVFGDFLTHYPANMQTVVLRKACTENLWFDEKLQVSEEYDFFLRVLLRCKADYISEPLVVYRYHDQMFSKKFNHLYPLEISYIVDKLRKRLPNFDQVYRREHSTLAFRIEYWKAKVAMKNGDRQEALRLLYSSPGLSLQKILFILLAWAGRSAWLKIHDMTGRY